MNETAHSDLSVFVSRTQKMNKTLKNQMLVSKHGYTLVEGLISMLIVSVIGIASVQFVSGYLKTTYERDQQMKTVIANMNVAERLKAEVKTLPQLLDFHNTFNIKIIAIGIGEVILTETADGIVINTVAAENHGFSERLQTNFPSLFRIVIGDDMPNTQITTMIRLEGT